MDEIIKYCRENKDEVVREILTSIGSRHCISYNSQFSFVAKVCEDLNNITVLSVYYCVIEFANAYYLKENNSKYANVDTSHFSECCREFSPQFKSIACDFINNYFNDEYKEILRREFGFGGVK